MYFIQYVNLNSHTNTTVTSTCKPIKIILIIIDHKIDKIYKEYDKMFRKMQKMLSTLLICIK